MDTDPGATKHVSGDWRGGRARDEHLVAIPSEVRTRYHGPLHNHHHYRAFYTCQPQIVEIMGVEMSPRAASQASGLTLVVVRLLCGPAVESTYHNHPACYTGHHTGSPLARPYMTTRWDVAAMSGRPKPGFEDGPGQPFPHVWQKLCLESSRVGEKLGGSMSASVHVAMSQGTLFLRVQV